MADVFTVVAKIRAAKGKGDALAELLREQVANVKSTEFDAHRKSPVLAAYRERREKDGLTQGGPEVEFHRSVTD